MNPADMDATIDTESLSVLTANLSETARILFSAGSVNSTLEQGIEKIAIYADGKVYEHAARQLANGKWTSKMGKGEVIEHDTPEDLVGPAYGQVVKFMQRKRPEKTDGR